MKKIYIWKEDKCWVAEFIDDWEIFDLFGTFILPTPFTEKAPVELVIGELAAKNPECIIEVKQDR